MEVNHALVANFNVANMSFNAIRENKVLAKVSGFTVIDLGLDTLKIVYKRPKTVRRNQLTFALSEKHIDFDLIEEFPIIGFYLYHVTSKVSPAIGLLPV